MISDFIGMSFLLIGKFILLCVYTGETPLMLVSDLVATVFINLDVSPQESFSTPPPCPPAFPSCCPMVSPLLVTQA